MTVSYACRQAVALARVLVEHIGSDPAFFGVQLSRRLPRRFSVSVGRQLRRVPTPVCQTAGRWLTGDTDGAESLLRQQLEETHVSSLAARLFGEMALSLRMGEEAAAFADRIASPRAAKGLRARIAWHQGDLNRAVALADRGRLHSRLQAERQTFEPGWMPEIPPRLPRMRAASTDVLYLLTNSLPHTRSGYTYRTQAVLDAVQRHGVNVLGATRTGYPVSVGRFSWSASDTVDGVSYLRDIPWNHGRTATQRLQKQVEFTAALATASRARVLHTTTHFVNGKAVASAAARLGLPWVYEVRGVLEETWAASAGTRDERRRSRASERYRMFRACEIETALKADRVVTLGETMAKELERRGVAKERILVAPNAVSRNLLDRDVTRGPSAMREACGLPTEGMWVGTAASIVGYEGLDLLIDAVQEVRRAGTDVRMLIVGDGVELPALMQRAAPLGDAAVFTGRVPQMKAQDLVSALDIFAVPRRNDPVCALVTPLKPVEAAGLARPVVLSDLPALTEALPSEARSAVEPGSVTKWAEELTRLAEDEQTRLEMGLAGRRFVAEHRTWDAVGRAYAEMYTALGVRGLA